jgi:hypothetical protein
LGVIDLVKMKAIHWDDSTHGIKFEEREIPEEQLKEAALGVRKWWSQLQKLAKS